METNTLTLLELFRLGGPVMWPLLLFSVLALAITIERAVYFIYHNLQIDSLKEKTARYVKQGDYQGAADFLAAFPKRHKGAAILLALVNGKSAVKAERAAEAEASACVSSLESGFNFLTALGSLSPLTGFLGTVTGMIGAFMAIAEADEVNARLVAGGIYEVLITTVFGLIVAIVAMTAHSVFSHIVDRFAAKTEASCGELLLLMHETEATAGETNGDGGLAELAKP